jgi:hypothetical protein
MCYTFRRRGRRLAVLFRSQPLEYYSDEKGVRLMIDAIHVQLLLTYTLVIIGVVALCINRKDK